MGKGEREKEWGMEVEYDQSILYMHENSTLKPIKII
jgi:hypothetical protein